MITRKEFESDRELRLAEPSTEVDQFTALQFEEMAVRNKYFYNFQWMGLPIIQFPADLIALQEIIWDTQPQVIIETGLAWGGSAVFYGSCLGMIKAPDKLVVSIEKHVLEGVDAAISDRFLNLNALSWVQEGSSVDPDLVNRVAGAISGRRTMVCLDSAHTPEHVEAELELYADLVSVGCYLIVFDTFVEGKPMELYAGKDHYPGHGPRQAVDSFLAKDDRFVIDERLDALAKVSSNHGGWLKKIRD